MLKFIQFLEATFTSRANVVRPDNPRSEYSGAELHTKHIPMKRPHPEETVHKVAINRLTANEPGKFEGDHSEESEKHINKIVHDIKAGKKIEPIKVIRGDKGSLHVVDGHHRVEAHMRAGKRHVPANIIGSSRVKNVDILKSVGND